jgi:S-adenosylmethionine:tRNA ribosyltransferase-isomerase
VSLRTDLFDYDLPERLIAQTPAARRDQSRLLVVDRRRHSVIHHVFADLPRFLKPGDILFRNNAAVIPARLHAVRPTGGRVECLLLRPAAVAGEWWCLVRPGRRLPVEARFSVAGQFDAVVKEKAADGLVRVAFTVPAGTDLLALADRLGEMPLPPYIHERATDAERAVDRERYQTVYADRAHQVAVAAPTAGLHFTPELLERISADGVGFADVTLHVGLGTFRPITAEVIEHHSIHREVYELPVETQRLLYDAGGGRRVAVGTTTVRSVEDFLADHDAPLGHPHVAETGLFIHPPRDFRGVDVLITNFHQPRSTLLCLVAAFLTPGSTNGIAWIKEIYAEAVAREYRFFSYGDAMLIL